MVLEQIADGASRRLSVFDEGTRKLVFITCLPLIDGVFATLLVTGAMETFSSVVSIAVTIFAGAGSLAVLYSYSESRRDALKMVMKAAPLLFAGALLVSMIAPVYEQLLHLERMKYVAGLVLLVIARDMLEIEFLESVSAEAVLLTGIVVSLKNPGSLAFSLEYIVPGLLTVSVAVIGLLAASLVNARSLNIDYVRRGAALVLVMISASMFGVEVPSVLNLALFTVSLAASHQRLQLLDLKPDV